MSAFPELLKIVLSGRALDRAQARAAMNALIGGGVTDAQAGAFLAALRVRGETVPELIGFAEPTYSTINLFNISDCLSVIIKINY